MKTLLLIRHAHADPGPVDHERALSARGRSEAARMGEFLKREDLVPERICCSSAVRAETTAEILARRCGYDGRVRVQERLYLAAPAVYLELLTATDDRVGRVLLVGHNPGAADLVLALAGRSESMATAALARIDLDVDCWRHLHRAGPGHLVGVWRPAEVGGRDP